MTAPAGRRGARGVAVALLGLTVVLLASSLVIGLTGGEGWTAVLGFIPVTITFTLVGALVAARTGNRLGWLFLGVGTVGAVTVARTSMRRGQRPPNCPGQRGQAGPSPWS
jgi:bacteriorhodopsin